MNFEGYLQNRKLSERSIKLYIQYTTYFFNWINSKAIEEESVSYTDLLSYVKDCRKEGKSTRYINHILGVLRHYYNFLKYEGKVRSNPATGLFLKGVRSRLPHDLLSEEQLEELYSSFKMKNPLEDKLYKTILGLMVYQGLSTGEVERLEVQHLKLREGKITIPASRKSLSRELKLEAVQVYELQEYVSSTREQLLRKRVTGSNCLFIGPSDYIYHHFKKLNKALRKAHSYYKDCTQLRESRIACWAEQYDLRYAQYLSGHRYVSSTERYERTSMKDLETELNKFHPLE
jgi:integrase/recombinase XerD